MAHEEQPAETTTIGDPSHLLGDMSRFYLSETFSDVLFHLSGQKIYGHKILLASKCKYFDTLLLREPKKSEFTLDNVCSKTFVTILKYIYTGSIDILSFEKDLALDVLKLAHEYSLTKLTKTLSEMIPPFLKINTVCEILNQANLLDVEELRDVCHKFIDDSVSKMVGKDFFNCLTQKSIIKLLERDTFGVPELDVFQIVANWCSVNEDSDDLAKNCIRLSLLNRNELLTVVRVSKLISNETLLNALTAIEDMKVPQEKMRLVNKSVDLGIDNNSLSSKDKEKLQTGVVRLVKDENIATAEYGAKVITGKNTEELLMEGSKKWASHRFNNEEGITVDLGALSCFNYITMNQQYSGSYFIEVSDDQNEWKKIIDYRDYLCQNNQNLYFHSQISQYVKIFSPEGVYLNGLKIFFKSSIPPIRDQIVFPIHNIATKDMGAILEYDDKSGPCQIITIYLAQPYIVSCIKFVLPPCPNKYVFEINQTGCCDDYWELLDELLVQRCGDWHTLSFYKRIILIIRIIAGSGNSLKDFSLKDIECFYKK